MKRYLFVLFCAAVSAQSALADEDFDSFKREFNELRVQMDKLQHVVGTQQSKIDILERENTLLKNRSESVAIVPAKQAPSSGSGSFVPEIGMVADVVVTSTRSKEDEEGNDRVSLRELELVIGHDVDPFTRFDSTIAFSDSESPDVEEAYLSFWDLPFGFKGRIGRIRPRIDKASSVHRDSLETVDEPLVVQSYLGVEGLSRSALELSNFLPFPWERVSHELSIGVMEGGVGEGGTLFGETRRQLSYYARLKNFVEISDDSDFELGSTYLSGSGDDDSAHEVSAIILDATVQHHFTPIKRLKLQTEFILQDRKNSLVPQSDETLDSRGHPWGFYTLIDYRASERYSTGGRYDYVLPSIFDSQSTGGADRALSAYLSYYQSEFMRFRTQYSHVDFGSGGSDDRIFLQATAAIGTHKHQLQ